jgi:hypothetical protein
MVRVQDPNRVAASDVSPRLLRSSYAPEEVARTPEERLSRPELVYACHRRSFPEPGSAKTLQNTDEITELSS